MVTEVGIGGLTIEEVAARAGVSRPTVYLRYPSKVHLVAGACASMMSELIFMPDTGRTRRDLILFVENLFEILATSPGGPMLRALVSESAYSPELAAPLEELLVARRSGIVRMLQRGIDRGDLRPDMDLELAVDMLVAPAHYRFLVSRRTLDRNVAEGIVDVVLTAFGRTGRRRLTSLRGRLGNADAGR